MTGEDRVATAIQEVVDAGQLAGAVTLAWRDDEVVQHSAIGWRNVAAHGFHYGHSTDLLGLLIARIENASLGEVLARRIFNPLGMTDTSFSVPSSKRARRAAMHGFDAEGRLTVRLTATESSTLPERPDDMAYESRGAGRWSPPMTT